MCERLHLCREPGVARLARHAVRRHDGEGVGVVSFAARTVLVSPYGAYKICIAVQVPGRKRYAQSVWQFRAEEWLRLPDGGTGEAVAGTVVGYYWDHGSGCAVRASYSCSEWD